MKTTLSIVTITYNAFEELEKTINSVKSQTFDSYEYIIIDGASTDGSLDIIKKYQKYITFSISEKDNGIYNAMNKSIDYCNGEWVIFMNSGDIFVDNFVLEKIFSRHYDDNIGVLYGYTQTGKGRMRFRPFVCKKKNSIQMGFCHQSTIVRCEILKKYKFDEHYKLAADYNLLFKLWKDGVDFFQLGIDIALFDTSGVSSTKQNKLLDEVASFTGLKGSFIYYLYKIKNFIYTLI